MIDTFDSNGIDYYDIGWVIRVQWFATTLLWW